MVNADELGMVRIFGLEHFEGISINDCLFFLRFPVTNSNSGALTHSKPSIHFPQSKSVPASKQFPQASPSSCVPGPELISN